MRLAAAASNWSAMVAPAPTCPPRYTARPGGLTPVRPRGVELSMILALHHQGLSEGLQLDRAGEIEVKLPSEQHLRHRVGERGAIGEPAGERSSRCGKLVVLDNLRRQADLKRAFRREVVAEGEQLHCAAETDEAW